MAFQSVSCRLSPVLASREATDPLTRYMKPLPALCAQLICAIYRAQLQTTSQQIADGDTDDKMIPRALRDTYAECLSRYETILNNPQDESNNRPAAHFTQYVPVFLFFLFLVDRSLPCCNTSQLLTVEPACSTTSASWPFSDPSAVFARPTPKSTHRASPSRPLRPS